MAPSDRIKAVIAALESAKIVQHTRYYTVVETRMTAAACAAALNHLAGEYRVLYHYKAADARRGVGRPYWYTIVIEDKSPDEAKFPPWLVEWIVEEVARG